MSRNLRTRAIFLMVLCSTMWSMAGIFIKMIDWNPFAIAGFRSLIASGVMFLYMKRAGLPVRVTRNSLLAGVSLGLTCLCFVSANKLTTSANAIVLQFTAPVFIMLLSALLFGQRFRRSDFLVVGLTILGITLCFFDQIDGGQVTGNAIAVFSGLTFASMFVFTGRSADDERMSGLLFGHLFTALIGVPTALFLPTRFTAQSVGFILILGIFQLGIPYAIYGVAAKHCSPLVCCLVSAIEPLLNPTWVFLFDGEAPGAIALLGGAIVIATITIWSIWSGRQEAEAEAEPVPALVPESEQI